MLAPKDYPAAAAASIEAVSKNLAERLPTTAGGVEESGTGRSGSATGHGLARQDSTVLTVQSLEIDAELLSALAPLFAQFGFSLAIEELGRSGVKKKVVIARNGGSSIYVISLPRSVLESYTDSTLGVVTTLTFIIGKKSKVNIISRDLDAMDFSFYSILKQWEEDRQTVARFLAWRHISGLLSQRDERQRLLDFREIFGIETGSVQAPPPPPPPSPPANNPQMQPQSSAPSTTLGQGLDMGNSEGRAHKISPDDKDAIIDIIAKRASVQAFGTPRQILEDLLRSAHLPDEWVQSAALADQARPGARQLVDLAIALGGNPEEPQFTALGSLLRALLRQKLSPDEARTVVAILVAYKLILDDRALQNVAARYMVPLQSVGEPAANYGPSITLIATQNDIELQSFLRPEPEWLDVGRLKRAMSRASSVCRIEVGGRSGTGFLLSPSLVLTNFHVLKNTADEDLQANAKKAVLRFGAFSLSGSDDEEEGQILKLADQEKVVAQSPVSELDFVLLRLEKSIAEDGPIRPAPLEDTTPQPKTSLNILHHPKGGPMKLSLSGNGITAVDPQKGLVQYVTAAAGGSSGSPCFNDGWKVVALHHAQQTRSFGSIREGILVGPIYERIKQHL